MAAGDMNVVIPETGRSDEVGMLADAMDRFKLASIERAREEQAARARDHARAEETTAVVGIIGEALEALARGDLTHRVSAELTGAFATLKDNFNSAVGRLQDTLQNVLLSAKQISSGAGEIANATGDLSRRTEQQAASLEETAAALQEITSTVNKTADNAKEAGDIVASAKAAAEEGGQVVETAVKPQWARSSNRQDRLPISSA